MDPNALGLAIGISIGAAFGLIFWLWYRTFALSKPSSSELESYKEQLRKEAEAEAKEVLLKAKEETIRVREEAEAEIKEKQKALIRQQEKLASRDEQVEQRRLELDQKEKALRQLQQQLDEAAQELQVKDACLTRELASVSKISKEEAQDLYISRLEGDFRELAAKRAKEIEAEAEQNAERKARKLVLDAMERSLTEYVTEATVAVVELPSEDMKGRIIGREGRNIRAFEQVTGVDLIIDETPEAVVISSFDPVRRETARLALMNLMADGRIHPVRIEELYEKAETEVQRMILDSGNRAVEEANIVGLPHKVIETMGRLRFRTSYAQNVLDHSVETSRIAAIMASELGLNAEVAKRAGFLHDIGKALGPEWEGPHALTGMEFLRLQGEKEPVLNAVGAHHYEIEPATPEAVVVILADTISAARPGARRESLDNYIKRLAALEDLANQFEGVERTYAIQAGREIRLIVKPEIIDDVAAARLAHDVARKIESELAYPGQIKVTVIRETRVQEVAK